MGCFDVYCLICNNTTNSAIILEECFDDINSERMIEGKKPFNIDKIQNFVKRTLHLQNCTFLTENNEVVHNCYEISGCGQFKDSNNNIYELLLHKEDINKNENIKYGLFLHTDCWEYIKNKLNIKLHFSDIIPNIINDLKNNSFVKIEYGGIIDKYIGGQFMNFKKIFEDDNLYLCYSPLEFDPMVNERIDKIIEQILL